MGRDSDKGDQATTPSTSAIATAGMRRWRDTQNAQIANAANATDSPNRSAWRGRAVTPPALPPLNTASPARC